MMKIALEVGLPRFYTPFVHMHLFAAVCPSDQDVPLSHMRRWQTVANRLLERLLYRDLGTPSQHQASAVVALVVPLQFPSRSEPDHRLVQWEFDNKTMFL